MCRFIPKEGPLDFIYVTDWKKLLKYIFGVQVGEFMAKARAIGI